MDVFIDFATLHVKHIDQNLNITKYIISLSREIMFHKRFLPKKNITEVYKIGKT